MCLTLPTLDLTIHCSAVMEVNVIGVLATWLIIWKSERHFIYHPLNYNLWYFVTKSHWCADELSLCFMNLVLPNSYTYKRLIDPFLLLFSVKYYTGINNGSIREERIRNISSFIYEFGMARFVSRNDNSCLHTREVWWQKNENFILEG